MRSEDMDMHMSQNTFSRHANAHVRAHKESIRRLHIPCTYHMPYPPLPVPVPVCVSPSLSVCLPTCREDGLSVRTRVMWMCRAGKVDGWERESPYTSLDFDTDLPLSLTKPRPVSALDLWRERERDREALARARERDSSSSSVFPKSHIIGARTAPLAFPSSRRPATTSYSEYDRLR